jgi:uncharacterized protein (TIGR02270 family)
MSDEPAPTSGNADLLPAIDRSPIPSVVSLHAEDAAHLRHVRTLLVRAPHVRLEQLQRHDERLAAHLDGLAVAGPACAGPLRELLTQPSAANMFVVAVRAIESRDAAQLRDLLALLPLVPDARRGLLSAFGWTSPARLHGIARSLLESDDAAWREIGWTACAMHRVDAGPALTQALSDVSVEAATRRSKAACAAGALGRTDLRDLCTAAAEAAVDEVNQCTAAVAAVALGDRRRAATVLRRLAGCAGPAREHALRCLLKFSEPDEADASLKALHADPSATRILIRAIGIAGLPRYVPWLVSRMQSAADARLAGESFSLITGVDLEGHRLDRPAPDDAGAGPSADPADAEVAMDEDENLPWPDPAKVADWWHRHGARFAPGTRYFVGLPPTPVHCMHVLGSGQQRQRRQAAEHLCLLQPGAPLFDVAAPAWRQRRALDRMGSDPRTRSM